MPETPPGMRPDLTSELTDGLVDEAGRAPASATADVPVVRVTSLPLPMSVVPHPASSPDPYVVAQGVVAALETGISRRRGEPSSQDLLDELLQRWLMPYAAATTYAYQRALHRFFAHCRAHGRDPLTVEADVVREYRAQLEAESPAHATAEMAAVRSFYRFIVADRVLDVDPTTGTTRIAPDTPGLAASLAVAGQDRSVAQLAAGFLLSYSGNTRHVYETGLRLWFTWCMEVGLDPLLAQRPHVDAFRAVADQRYAPSTVNARMAVIRSFYAYCLDVGATTTNPTRGVRSHRLPNVSSSTGLSRGEARALLEAAQRHDPCIHALFTVMLLNGLRISEALNANAEDFTTVRDHPVLMVQRKGYTGTVQPVPLSPLTHRTLKDWLAVRPTRLRNGEGWTATTGPLFLNTVGRRMIRGSARAVLRKLAAEAAPTKVDTLHPHDLRNAFVTLSLDAGVPLRDVQDSAGHLSSDTTRRYDTGRNNLDRNATYTLSAYLSGGTSGEAVEADDETQDDVRGTTPRFCGAGCGCRWGTDDPDAYDCDCTGDCTAVPDAQWFA
jgi:integrase/recombinase XerD